MESPKASAYIDVRNTISTSSVGTSTKCTLSWSDLTYTVPSKKESTGEKTILKNVNGRCAPGTLTAIMGPSGSGKTTLLDILADRISSGTINGQIELNGQKRKPSTLRSVTSYVAQEDSLLGSFTVLETLHMSAKLSLPNSVSSKSIKARVQHVIDAMGLRTCEHTLVGDMFHKGLSGGQKRRLSIAIELLSNPSILLLDEPTSGLDSASTYNIMKYLRLLCEEGKTIVCTIHQPSSLVFDMFSNVMILTTGKTIYFGPQTEIIHHFSLAGYDCPQYSNPAEYFIELSNNDFEGHADIPKLLTSYLQSNVASKLMSDISADRYAPESDEKVTAERASAFRQFMVLIYRNTLNNIRNPGIYWVRLFMYTILSLMLGTMYLSTNDDISLDDITVLLFYVFAFLVFMSVAVLPFFIDERAVFARERANSQLNVFSYVLANFWAALPGIGLIALISSCLVVYLAGINGFGWFVLNLFLSLVVAESLMKLIAALVPHYIIGIALGAGIFGMFMLCAGFMVPRDAIPSYWIWGYYIAFHSYSFKSFVFEHYSHETDPHAAEILARLNMEDVDVPMNMIILICYAIGLELIFTFVVYRYHTGRR